MSHSTEASSEKYPGEQSVQFVRAVRSASTFPRGQTSQDTGSGRTKKPASHGSHGVAGLVSRSAEDKISQRSQSTCSADWVPTEQLLQGVDGSVSKSAWPASQSVQIYDPGPEYCPSLHKKHASLGSALKRPAAHVVHLVVSGPPTKKPVV
eukprot:SAG31_NODE_22972_length_514_cov_0.768675_1_plen_150_part_10